MTRFQLVDFPELLAIYHFFIKDPQMTRPAIKSRSLLYLIITQLRTILGILKKLKKVNILQSNDVDIFNSKFEKRKSRNLPNGWDHEEVPSSKSLLMTNI
jgi:hypothetical protein